MRLLHPGMLMTARDIVTRLPDADEKRIRLELSGNLCRCTGYVGIVEAVQSALATVKASGHAGGCGGPRGRAGWLRILRRSRRTFPGFLPPERRKPQRRQSAVENFDAVEWRRSNVTAWNCASRFRFVSRAPRSGAFSPISIR